MNIWVTSDNHFSHKNIIKHCNRPFGSVSEMNSAMIEIWNASVKDSDIVFHLGDFALADDSKVGWILEKLNGKKVLIAGNHDDDSIKRNPIWKGVFESYTLKFSNKVFKMNHYPYPPSAMKDADYFLHGHSHGNLGKFHDGQIDVGVDSWDFSPVSIEEIMEVSVV